MRLDLTLFASAVALMVGFLAVWSNPTRAINRVFGTLSLHAVTWLLCLRGAFVSEDGLFWIRWASAIGAFFPLHLWVVKETVVLRHRGPVLFRGKAIWIFSALLLLASVSFTGWFVPAYSTAAKPVYGSGYYAYIGGLLLAYILLSRETIAEMRSQSGVSRLELQMFLLGGCAAAAAIILFMGLRAVLGGQFQVRLQPVFVLVFYAATVVAITTHKIFDARQILLVCAEKAVLVVATAGFAFVSDLVLGPIMPPVIDLIVTTALALWFARVFGTWLDQRFHFYAEASRARQAAFSAAGKEARLDKLLLAFLSILKGWGQSDRAIILSGNESSLTGGEVELGYEGVVAKTMRQIRWATPERLAREKPTPERQEVAKFLADHALGVLISSEGPTLKVLVGVGVPASRRPFTYPQVMQLIELAAIVENALERAHLSAKAQHAEQLATVGLLGASLAHEIRNPLVSIKTFVQLLPDHYQDQAFRNKFFRLIGDEVTRIDRLTEQLLDLASPRVYTAKPLELHPVIRTGLDLVAAKAAGKNIELRQDMRAQPDRAYADPAAVKQVLLNLCFNAIQAVETQFGERWVLVATRNTSDGVEMSVSDSGPGIATEIRPRLFQPFQSTKSSGFGLGLAICKDILGNLNAVITVDHSTPGSGATFRVVFPCQPS